MSVWLFLAGMWCGGLIPVVLEFCFDRRSITKEDWLPLALFVIGWPIASAYAAWKLLRGEEI